MEPRPKFNTSLLAGKSAYNQLIDWLSDGTSAQNMLFNAING